MTDGQVGRLDRLLDLDGPLCLLDVGGAQAGDYLESPLPGDMDVVLLANVVHQERPESAQRLVARAAAALRPGGRLVVVDFRLEADRCHPTDGRPVRHQHARLW